jgi:hypothetical protein
MVASYNGHLKVVRTLLEGEGDVNAQNEVRKQIMMMMIIILLTILMMIILLTILMMMPAIMIVINDEDRDDCR